MPGPVGSKSSKVSGKSAGKNASFKKGGYATNPPDYAIPTKPGVVDERGYSGPNVQQGEFNR